MSKALAFISHSAKDKKTATNLARRLQQYAVDVWIDHEQIKFGDSIPAKISNGLSTCDVILVVVSSSFVGSSWCRAEYEPLLTREIESGKTFVIPICIDDADLPVMLSAKRYVDLRNGFNDQTIGELAQTIIDGRSYTHLQRIAPKKPPSYECSLLGSVVSGVLSEVPVSSLHNTDLLSGKSLLDLYRAVDKLIQQYQDLCDEILKILLESNIKDHFYGSGRQIAETTLVRSNRKLLRISRDMRDISNSLDGLLKSDSAPLQRFKGLAEICTLISVAENFLILKLGRPSVVPDDGAARIEGWMGETPDL
ncbi:MAG: toll/interleukin-1 receptor domain-containing protein, partial [Nitrospiraceae bacterium]|nr:toll/interleukin-1 receptor domain-containing protein [Nitrospiraceae bacterium]